MTDLDKQIAAIDPDALAWLNEQASAFMQPVAESMGADEAQEYGLDGPGWYARLSAPGYLDATDWQGPYDTEAQALVSLYEVFGD